MYPQTDSSKRISLGTAQWATMPSEYCQDVNGGDFLSVVRSRLASSGSGAIETFRTARGFRRKDRASRRGRLEAAGLNAGVRPLGDPRHRYRARTVVLSLLCGLLTYCPGGACRGRDEPAACHAPFVRQQEATMSSSRATTSDLRLVAEPRTAMIRTGEAVAAFALSLAVAVALQLAEGAYQSGFGGHPDEAAHLITAVMVRDFLAGLDYRHPWDFAVQYYLHYPKVAIGHWPPLLYATAAGWFLVFGASRTAALLFIAVIAAATSSLVYWTGKRLIARWVGGVAALLFLASPLVQESSARFMTEHAVTLAMLASTLRLARFASTGLLFDGLSFGILAAAAILTRGSGWALVPVPALTMVLTRRWRLLSRPGLWLAALPVLA